MNIINLSSSATAPKNSESERKHAGSGISGIATAISAPITPIVLNSDLSVRHFSLKVKHLIINEVRQIVQDVCLDKCSILHVILGKFGKDKVWRADDPRTQFNKKIVGENQAPLFFEELKTAFKIYLDSRVLQREVLICK